MPALRGQAREHDPLQMPSRVIASTCGLAGFAVAVLAGLSAGNPAISVLVTAMVALFICHVVGIGVGTVCERIVFEHMQRYERENPVPAIPGVAAPSAVVKGGDA